MQPANTSQSHNKTVLVNVAIVAGLLFQYFRGTPLIPVIIAGIFLLVVANLLILITTRNRTSSTNR